MIRLPSGEELPALGQGTRGMAADPWRRDAEIATVRAGIDLGLTVIDATGPSVNGETDEVEKLIGTAVADRRDEVFLICGLPPTDATSRVDTLAACEGALRRLNTDRIDLYLLRPRGAAELAETVEAFTALITVGRIRHWGVGDFDLPDLVELTGVPGGTAVEVDQVPYSLTRRSIEWDLLPRCHEAGLPVMARAPLDRGRILDHPTLARVAERHDASPAQIALAWILRQDGVFAIPRATNPEQARQNRDAAELVLTTEDLAELDRSFPPPDRSPTLEPR